MSGDAIEMTGRESSEAHAIRLCLDELGVQAEAQGWTLAANLIGAASRAISDEIFRQDIARRLEGESAQLAEKAK